MNLLDYYFIKDKPLGRGGFGKVFKVISRDTYKKLPPNTIVTAKIIENPEVYLDDIFREINILKDISSRMIGCNPGIVCYYDNFHYSYKDKNYLVIIMEYIEGVNL